VSSRLPIVLGLILGAVAAVALFAGAAILVPDTVLPVHSPAPPATFAVASPTPRSSPTSTASASTGTGSSGTPGPTDASAAATNFHVGQAAPALVVSQIGGGTLDLSALRGKPVWVNFMATWCPPCRDELPLMNGFAARYANNGLVVVAIDVREDEGLVASFAQSLNTTFPVALDPDGAAQRTWQAYALPVHYWVDAQGIVRDGALGGIGPDIMARGLRSILPGVDVKP
jgi:thiol-disulfide isomerase/thioredoxin